MQYFGVNELRDRSTVNGFRGSIRKRIPTVFEIIINSGEGPVR